MVPYVDELVPVLLQNLASESVSLDSKLFSIMAIGDIILSCSVHCE